MKITAINREHSDKNAIALVTEPPLTPPVFEELNRRIRPPALQSLSFEMVSGCLLIQPERFTPELRVDLDQLLSEAEDVVNGVAARKQAEINKIAARKQAEIDQSEKELTLESAAAGFGLPIV